MEEGYFDHSSMIFKHKASIFKIMGRPSTKPRDLKDGFYIEVRNKNSKTGVKIRRDNKEQMLSAIEQYQKVKEVVVFGELKNGKLVTN